MGLYNDQTAQDAASDCKDCVIGKFNDQTGQDAATDCKDCAVGLYQDQAAQSSCITNMTVLYYYSSNTGMLQLKHPPEVAAP